MTADVDFVTDLEQTHARILANQLPSPEPIRIDLANTRRSVKTGTVFHAWMEGSDMWDGWALYTNLSDALQTAASDYVSEEYGDPDDDDAFKVTLEWRFDHGSWHLFDGPDDTGVHVTETAVYTAEGTAPAAVQGA